ncbi:MAG: hypothetical protein AAGL89_01030 [Pseudomonadota bacterium]
MEKIRLKNTDFEIHAADRHDAYHVFKQPRFLGVRFRDVYFHNCKPPGKGTYLTKTFQAPPPSTRRQVALVNMVVVQEYDVVLTRSKVSEYKSDEMEMKVMDRLGIHSYGALEKLIATKAGTPKVDIPVGHFSKYNQLISYVIQMETKFELVRLKAPDLGLNFAVALPRHVNFTYRTINYCKPDAWKRAIAQTPELYAEYGPFAGASIDADIPKLSGDNYRMRKKAAEGRRDEATLEIEAHGELGVWDGRTEDNSNARLDDAKRSLTVLEDS